ncbi:MAG: cupin domain-containing protein [Verrucomicrobia bacterium]|nr:cupin domain-containing protein [Verrucomicrobiota bacterium]
MKAKLYHFDKMPLEAMKDKVYRRWLHGQNGMLVHFDLKKGAIIPDHHHVSEQITYIVKGKVRVFVEEQEFIVSAGDVLVIPPNAVHRFEALEDTIDIDIFAPVRQDWIEGTESYLKKK